MVSRRGGRLNSAGQENGGGRLGGGEKKMGQPSVVEWSKAGRWIRLAMEGGIGRSTGGTMEKELVEGGREFGRARKGIIEAMGREG